MGLHRRLPHWAGSAGELMAAGKSADGGLGGRRIGPRGLVGGGCRVRVGYGDGWCWDGAVRRRCREGLGVLYVWFGLVWFGLDLMRY